MQIIETILSRILIRGVSTVLLVGLVVAYPEGQVRVGRKCEAATLWDTMAVGISTMRSTTFSQRVPTIASTPRYGSKINVITWQVALPRLMRLLVGSSASPTSLPRMLP